jgi:hypothetical protein
LLALILYSVSTATARSVDLLGARVLDQASGVTGWTLHDLRRTARSLMARPGVQGEHAERCLGHVIRGVEGIYNRHGYAAEMRIEYEKLAALIEEIVNSQANSVTTARS